MLFYVDDTLHSTWIQIPKSGKMNEIKRKECVTLILLEKYYAPIAAASLVRNPSPGFVLGVTLLVIRLLTFAEKASQPKWKPVDLKELLDRCGSLRVAITPATRAHKDAKTNAGIFPPPNRASHGPAPSDIII